MTELCRNIGTVLSRRRSYPMLSSARQDLSNASCHAVFLSNSGGACAAYRDSAAVGSLRWILQIVKASPVKSTVISTCSVRVL